MVSTISGFSIEGVKTLATSFNDSFVGRLVSRFVSHLQQNHSSAVGVIFMANMATLHLGNRIAEMVGRTVDTNDVDGREKKLVFEAIVIGGTVAAGNFILSKAIPGSMSLPVIAALSVAAIALRTFFLPSHGNAHHEEVNTLKTTLGTKEGEVDKLRQDLGEAHAGKATLSEELETIRAQLQQLDFNLSNAQEDHRGELQKASAEAEQLRQDLISNRDELEAKIRSLQEELAAANKENKGLELILTHEKGKVQSLINTEKELREELEGFQNSLNVSQESAVAENLLTPDGDSKEGEATSSAKKQRRGSFKTLKKALSFRSDKKEAEGT